MRIKIRATNCELLHTLFAKEEKIILSVEENFLIFYSENQGLHKIFSMIILEKEGIPEDGEGNFFSFSLEKKIIESFFQGAIILFIFQNTDINISILDSSNQNVVMSFSTKTYGTNIVSLQKYILAVSEASSYKEIDFFSLERMYKLLRKSQSPIIIEDEEAYCSYLGYHIFSPAPGIENLVLFPEVMYGVSSAIPPKVRDENLKIYHTAEGIIFKKENMAIILLSALAPLELNNSIFSKMKFKEKISVDLSSLRGISIASDNIEEIILNLGINAVIFKYQNYSATVKVSITEEFTTDKRNIMEREMPIISIPTTVYTNLIVPLKNYKFKIYLRKNIFACQIGNFKIIGGS